MSIDLKTIKHISKLSRISVDEKKAEKLAGDLNSIFDFIEKLNELNTNNIEPLTSVAETTLKLRSDEICCFGGLFCRLRSACYVWLWSRILQ